MIALLFAVALADTVVDYTPEDQTVYVHEWGVVTLSGEMFVGSVPETEILDPWETYEMEDKAPVVYFYGVPFTGGQFTVELNGGRFTDIFPLPEGASLDGESVTWTISSTEQMSGTYVIPREDLPAGGTSCGWELDSWRDGGALVLDFPDGTRDRFLYYECAFPADPGAPPYPFRTGGGVDPDYDAPVLVFDLYAGEAARMAVCQASDAMNSTLEWVPYTRSGAIEAVCGMAMGDLKSAEIEDLWDTWERYVTGGDWTGDRLMIFRLPYDLVEQLSTLNLETSEGYRTQMTRFYLGMSPFSYTF